MDKYKVLIVDDEPLSTEGLKLMIDWDNLGFNICGECQSGEEALESIKKLRPHLVITDIKMPVMDGLELISETRKQMDYDVKFIIMSGFAEFEYARRAMQSGVNHYILKPLMNEEITDILCEVHKEIEKQAEIYKLQDKSDYKQIEELIYSALGGELEKEEIDILNSFEHNKNKETKWYYIILNTNNFIDVEETLKANNIEKIVEESLEDIINWVMVPYEGIYGIVAGCFKDMSSLTEYIKNIMSKITEKTQIRIYAAVGDGVETLADMKHSFDTANKALSYSFFEGTDGIVYYDHIKEKNFSYAFEKVKYFENIIEATENSEELVLEKNINDAFEHFRSVFLAPQIIQMLVLHVVNKVATMLKSIDGNTDAIFEIYQNISRQGTRVTLSDIEELVRSCCYEYIRQVKLLRGKSSNIIIDKLEDFIRNNYKRSITLKEMARELYLHPAYLGQLFYKIYGVSFNEYLHKLRIQEAKRLLAISNTKSHEVAAELGYCNYNSFLQYFERYEGIKPLDYKNSIKN